jgi:hypothetical protein
MAEECAEIIKAIDKALRFGLDNHYPNDDREVANREWILDEINDFLGACNKAIHMGVLIVNNPLKDESQINQKVKKIEWFMNYSRKLGTLKSRRAKGLHNRLRRKIFEWKEWYTTDEEKKAFKTERRPYMSEFVPGSGK